MKPTLFADDIPTGASGVTELTAYQSLHRTLPSRCHCVSWPPPPHDLTAPHFACEGRGWLYPPIIDEWDVPEAPTTSRDNWQEFCEKVWEAMGIMDG